MLSLLTSALLLALPGDPDNDSLPCMTLQDAGTPKSAIGLHLGYLQHPDAEDATVFYGIHFRLALAEIFSVEASVDVAKSDFANNDAELSLVPVQVTAILAPFKDLPIRPYGLAGVGWYFTDVDYSGALAGTPSESENTFGLHLGAGAELPLGRTLLLHADFRWIFMGDPDWSNPAISDEDVDYWQLMLGASLRF